MDRSSVPVGSEAIEADLSSSPPGEPVILNVYDMFWTNEYTGNMGLGVYHSGLQVRRGSGRTI